MPKLDKRVINIPHPHCCKSYKIHTNVVVRARYTPIAYIQRILVRSSHRLPDWYFSFCESRLIDSVSCFLMVSLTTLTLTNLPPTLLGIT